MTGQYVTELRPADVLFGRGSGPNDHEGNIRFRKLVAERKNEYMATSHRMTKAKIAKEIVDKVYAENGRFLKKLEPAEAKALGIPDGVDAYEMADSETVMEKAKQALRQNTNKQKSDSKGTTTPPKQRIEPEPTPKYPPSVEEEFDLEPIPLSTEVYGQTGRNEAIASTDYMQSQGRDQPVAWISDSPISRRPTRVPEQISSYSEPEQDSMLAHLPAEMRASYQSTYDHHLDDDAAFDDRRGSMTVSDLYRARNLSLKANAMQMSDLVDSFKSMKASGVSPEDAKAFMASSETMGTIEPISAGSVADMSLGTMNSSTFSVFRGTDDLMPSSDEKSSPLPERVTTIAEPPLPSLRNFSVTSSGRTVLPSRFTSDSSLSISGVWADRRKSSSVANSLAGASVDMRELSGSLAEHPRPVALMEGEADPLELEGMGQSSISFLKHALAPTYEGEQYNSTDQDNMPYYAGSPTAQVWRRENK